MKLPTTFSICQKGDVLYIGIRCGYDEKGGKRAKNTDIHDGTFWNGADVEVRGLKGANVTPNKPGKFRDPYTRVADGPVRAKAEPSLVPAEEPAMVGQSTIKASKKKVTVSLEVNTPTDVAVWVEDPKGEVVRHLAAGLLGSNAPDPLKKDSLKQTLTWDRKDDWGKPVPPGAYQVKIGVKSVASLDRVIGRDPAPKDIQALGLGSDGTMYVLGSLTSTHGHWVELNKLAKDGTRVKMLYPPPADVPPERLKGMSIIDYGAEGQVRVGSHQIEAFLPHLDVSMPHSILVNSKGHSSCCCASVRLAVDDFCCVYVPAMHRNTVRMLDAAGNEILRIGRYGNMDSYGPGSPVPKPEIGLLYPVEVALSKKYLYIGEWRCSRVNRVKLGYAVEREESVVLR